MARGIIIKDAWGAEAATKFWCLTADPDPVTGCINWLGCQAGQPKSRYGHFFVAKRTFRAHVYSMIISNPTLGTVIPPGLQVNHNCNNKLCVNPKHLYLGTQMDNINDTFASGNPVGQKKIYDSEHVEEMIKLYRAGHTLKMLSDKFGSNYQFIAQILKGHYRMGFPFIPLEEYIALRNQNVSARQKENAKGRKKPREDWSKWHKLTMIVVENAGFKTVGEYRRFLKERKKNVSKDTIQPQE